MVLNDWDERWLIKGGHSLHERMTLSADLKSLMQSADFASQTRTVPSLLPLNKRVTQSFQSAARAKSFFYANEKTTTQQQRPNLMMRAPSGDSAEDVTNDLWPRSSLSIFPLFRPCTC